ncbi:cyclomaltodextrinase N-terminal domain-containing protein, partial [Longispora fulva]|uniref:cyclomaltodextrinase N-terminal domain-containing protein n=2 Tax=Bacteria TaxID=2 RepID=UPI00363B0F22
MKKMFFVLVVLISLSSFAQIQRVEPPNWWTGFKDQDLQLLVYGKEIGKTVPEINYNGVSIEEVHKADSPNYLFIDLSISEEAKPGKFDIRFKKSGGKTEVFKYELKARQ